MIIDWDYFANVYLGKGVAQAEFPRLEMRAEDSINIFLRGALLGFDSLETWQKDYVKKAIASQVEYYGSYSTNVGFAEEEGKGFTVGKVSVTARDSAGYASERTYISPVAIGYLSLAGILNRGVAVLC